ncbi:MAG: glycosyltransferase family 39 protein [Planctomycetota bacterium]
MKTSMHRSVGVDETPLTARSALGPERWIAVVFLAIVLGAVSFWSSLVVPWPRGADEIDHFHYAHHIMSQKALPDPNVDPVLEAHHPPLAYALEAVWLKLLLKVDDRLGDDFFESRDWSQILGRKTTFNPGQRPVENGNDFEVMAGSWDTAVGKRTESVNDMLRDSSQVRSWVNHALRLPSVLLGIWTMFFLLAAIRYLLPTNPGLAVLTWAAIVLLPLYALHFSTLSNDPLVTWLSALTGWLVLRARFHGKLDNWKSLALISVVLGFGFLTKLNTLGMAAFAFFVTLLARSITDETTWKRRFASASILVIGPVVIAAWWHLRQVYLQGSPISSANHANFRPDLLRLESYHPVISFDFASDMINTLLGRFGNDGLESHSLYYVLASSFIVFAIFGVVFLRRRHESAPFGTGARNRPPLAAAALGVGLLILNLALLDTKYYARSGRYLLPVLIPMIALGLIGLNRLFGARLKIVVAAAAVLNAAGLAFLVGGVVMTTYTISQSKFERGRVVAYFDCGHPMFDQKGVGGLATPRIQRHRQLTPPRHTVLFGLNQDPEPMLSYKVEIPNPERPLQIRVRYPSIRALAGHDVPDPYLICMFINGQMVSGPISPWGEFGDRRIAVPAALSATGKLQISWKNHARNNPAFAIAEIWVEEAFVQFREAPATDGRIVRGALINIDDQQDQVVTVLAIVGDVVVGNSGALSVPADTTIALNLSLKRALSSSERADLKLRLIDHAALLVSDTKLLHWGPKEFPQAGRMEVPDVAVLRHRSQAAEKILVSTQWPGLPASRYRLEISHLVGQEPFSRDGLELVIRGGRHRGDAKIVDADHGSGLRKTVFEIERTAGDLSQVLAVEIIAKSKADAGSEAKMVELDRIRLWFQPSRHAPGSEWKPAESP